MGKRTSKINVGDRVRMRRGPGVPADEDAQVGTVKRLNTHKPGATGTHAQATVEWEGGKFGPQTGRHPLFMLDIFHDRREDE